MAIRKIISRSISDDAVAADDLANSINTSIAAKAPIASPSFTGNVVTQGVNPTITIQDSDEAGDGFIKFKTANGTQRGYIQTAMTSDVMIFGTGTTERMRLISSGGLTFNGDTAAANALDDYEEGTWTPAFAFGGGTTGIAYLNTAGNYTKIGRRVSLTGYIQISSKGSSTGSAFLTGFPFTSGSGNGNASAMAMAMVNCSFADNPQIEMDPATNSAGIRETAASNGAATAITDANFANNVFMRFSISYNT
jgi:hypothetical protein